MFADPTFPLLGATNPGLMDFSNIPARYSLKKKKKNSFDGHIQETTSAAMKKYARQPVLTFKRGEPTDPTIDNSGRMQRKSKAKTTFSGVLELREPSLLGRSHRYADAGVPLHSVEPS